MFGSYALPTMSLKKNTHRPSQRLVLRPKDSRLISNPKALPPIMEPQAFPPDFQLQPSSSDLDPRPLPPACSQVTAVLQYGLITRSSAPQATRCYTGLVIIDDAPASIRERRRILETRGDFDGEMYVFVDRSTDTNMGKKVASRCKEAEGIGQRGRKSRLVGDRFPKAQEGG